MAERIHFLVVNGGPYWVDWEDAQTKLHHYDVLQKKDYAIEATAPITGLAIYGTGAFYSTSNNRTYVWEPPTGPMEIMWLAGVKSQPVGAIQEHLVIFEPDVPVPQYRIFSKQGKEIGILPMPTEAHAAGYRGVVIRDDQIFAIHQYLPGSPASSIVEFIPIGERLKERRLFDWDFNLTGFDISPQLVVVIDAGGRYDFFWTSDSSPVWLNLAPDSKKLLASQRNDYLVVLGASPDGALLRVINELERCIVMAKQIPSLNFAKIDKDDLYLVTATSNGDLLTRLPLQRSCL